LAPGSIPAASTILPLHFRVLEDPDWALRQVRDPEVAREKERVYMRDYRCRKAEAAAAGRSSGSEFAVHFGNYLDGVRDQFRR